MSDKKKAILLRIPPDLWESLNRWARDEIRSLNAQIEFVLREAVRKRAGDRPPTPPTQGLADDRADRPDDRPENDSG